MQTEIPSVLTPASTPSPIVSPHLPATTVRTKKKTKKQGGFHYAASSFVPRNLSNEVFGKIIGDSSFRISITRSRRITERFRGGLVGQISAADTKDLRTLDVSNWRTKDHPNLRIKPDFELAVIASFDEPDWHTAAAFFDDEKVDPKETGEDRVFQARRNRLRFHFRQILLRYIRALYPTEVRIRRGAKELDSLDSHIRRLTGMEPSVRSGKDSEYDTLHAFIGPWDPEIGIDRTCVPTGSILLDFYKKVGYPSEDEETTTGVVAKPGAVDDDVSEKPKTEEVPRAAAPQEEESVEYSEILEKRIFALKKLKGDVRFRVFKRVLDAPSSEIRDLLPHMTVTERNEAQALLKTRDKQAALETVLRSGSEEEILSELGL